jgi:CcmD family protein
MRLDTYTLSLDGKLEALARSDQPSGDAPKAARPESQGDQRGTEFRSVEGGTESMDGNTLMVEAYAALWLILFGFIFVSWRRQGRMDARIDELERALTSSRGTAK